MKDVAFKAVYHSTWPVSPVSFEASGKMIKGMLAAVERQWDEYTMREMPFPNKV
jgi:hypothetical protein